MHVKHRHSPSLGVASGALPRLRADLGDLRGRHQVAAAQHVAVSVHGSGGRQQVRPQLAVEVRVVEAGEGGQRQRREQDRRRPAAGLRLTHQLVVPHQHAHSHLTRRLRVQLLLQLLALCLVASVLEPDFDLRKNKGIWLSLT